MIFAEVTKHLNFPEIEHLILKFWDDCNIFDKYKEKNKGKKKWSFQDGPITANGPMGVHHAWGRAYKDIFQRYKTMKGFSQRYQNGFDCQGLWVEVGIERELGFKSKRDIEKYGIDKFVERCKESVHKYSMLQTEQSIRLGMWMDWGDWKTSMDDNEWLQKSHSYYTMSEVNNYTIWHFLKKCHERGFLYEGVDVMPWCARCGTAISDMEIATEGYQELTHKAVIIRFPIIGKKDEYLLVWTTTPWTLTSNTGVAVHPDLTYVKVKNNGATYYLSKNLLHVLKGRYEVLQELAGRKLLGSTYEGPFDYLPAQKGIVHKVIPWEEVSESEGTGLVHIAPGCGKEDFALGKEFDLKTVAPLDELGIYVDGFDWLTGRDVKDVAEPIIEDLKKRNILYNVEDYRHRYPVCWRCDSELIFRLVDEWFINMDNLRHKIMDVAKRVERWIPSFGLDRELDWLRNMADWCISRKRYWGLALPIWKCQCGYFMVIGSKDELRAKAMEGWNEFDGHSPHRPWVDKIKIQCEKCGAPVSRIPDVGSPWLDAGIVPYSTIRPPDDMHTIHNGYPYNKTYWKEWFPADFITESFPGQFRNWFYAILTMSTVLEERAPFKEILGYATMRDEHGEEMHKSKGNAIEFDEAAEKVGADVMRWMFAKHNPVQNLNFGYGPAKEIKKILLTLWNVHSFFVTYANIDDFNPRGKTINEKNLTTLDRWILSRLNTFIVSGDTFYEKYELMSVVKEAEKFFDDLSNWYVRRSRRRFWKSENDADKETAYLVLYKCLLQLIKIISPIMPFLTEHMYQNLIRRIDSGAPESIHLVDFSTADKNLIDASLEDDVTFTRTIVSLGRAARNKANIKIRQPLGEMIVTLDDRQLSTDDQAIIKQELNIRTLTCVEAQELDKLLQYSVAPNFTTLGPKFGKSVKKIATVITSLNEKEIITLDSTGVLRKKCNGEDIEIHTEDVEIKRSEQQGWSVVVEEKIGVGISTAITKELENEGLARELIHKIQLLRKQADFNLVDRIRIFYQTSSKLKEAIQDNLEYLKTETLAVEVSEGAVQGDIEEVLNINGIETKIALQRVKK
ncbi:isoleucyl-tRNA synthetase [candidate division TA06 bacterium DG_78]|uniref:Isoleucine--tRNA ligase n=1 Tax=candidate division TA06 bacterium DG_78 TaxID=1703772 RepID=A0A0S7YI34_UNCT6|nr:MAG: isoleucyl-tRNA synthetase [candidate division TA06 bacterium DG_78]